MSKPKIEQPEKVRVPFLISVDAKLYVHFSKVSQKDGLEAFKGHFEPVRKQLEAEIRQTESFGVVKVLGMLAWGSSLETISLSEFGLRLEDVK